MPEVDAIIPVVVHTRAMDTVVGAEAAMAAAAPTPVALAAAMAAVDMPAVIAVAVAVTAVAAPEAEVTGNHRAAGHNRVRDG